MQLIYQYQVSDVQRRFIQEYAILIHKTKEPNQNEFNEFIIQSIQITLNIINEKMSIERNGR
jgi:hypothetical protein